MQYCLFLNIEYKPQDEKTVQMPHYSSLVDQPLAISSGKRWDCALNFKAGNGMEQLTST